MTAQLTDARRTLADAQAELKKAAEAQARIGADHAKLLAVVTRHTELAAQLEAAQQAHSADLVAWASAGAEGDPPPAPAAVEKLARDVAAAARAAEAAKQAAAQHQAKVDEAAQIAWEALQRLRAARREVLAEVAAPMILEYRQARSKAEAMLQHTFGLQAIVRDLKDEVPSVGDLTHKIGMAMNFHPVLEPGGAEYSRQQWRELVRALFDDPNAELGPAPNVIDTTAKPIDVA